MTAVQVMTYAVGLRFTQLSLRLFGFRRTVRILGALPVRFDADASQIPRWVASVDRVTAQPRVPSCLDRSVFLWFVMRLHGVDGELRIGVSPAVGGRIDGHAWVEHEDIVVNDEPDVVERFAVFDGEPIRIAFS